MDNEETPQVESSGESNKTMLTIAIAVVVVLVLGGGFFFLNKGNTVNAPAAPTPTTGAMVISPTAMATSPSGAAMDDEKMAVEEKKITLTKTGYSPASVTIKAGTKVTWTNDSGEVATVNSDPHPTHTNYPPLNLGRFNDGESLSLTFDKPGTYGYHNHLDASRKGTIIVQ